MVQLGNLVRGVHLGLQVHLLVLLLQVVLLHEFRSLDLVGGEELQVLLCFVALLLAV